MLRRIILSILAKLNPFSKLEKGNNNVVKFQKNLNIRETQTNELPKKEAFSETALKETIKNLPKVRVKHVIDGDTIIILKGWSEIRIRLDSIDCPQVK